MVFFIFRSFYNTLTMKYSHLYNVKTTSYNVYSLTVDWNESTVYHIYRGDIFKFNLKNLQTTKDVSSSFEKLQISVDPYNR